MYIYAYAQYKQEIFLFCSHAIAVYLVEKYAADDSLYPKDLQLRATLWQRLIFDASVLFHILKRICVSLSIVRKIIRFSVILNPRIIFDYRRDP